MGNKFSLNLLTYLASSTLWLRGELSLLRSDDRCELTPKWDRVTAQQRTSYHSKIGLLVAAAPV